MAAAFQHRSRARTAARARRADAGNAMVVALLVLMVLTSAGVAFVAVTKSEKQISGNQMSAAQALYAAESGITEGLHRMAFPAESLNYIGPAGNPVAGWGRYIVLANGASALDPDRTRFATDGLDNDEDGTADESGECYPEVTTRQTISSSTLRYPYVRVEYKTQGTQLVRFGDGDGNPLTPPGENLTLGAPVLRLTAAGRRGNAAKTLEAEAVRFPLVTVASTIWTGKHLKVNGNAFLVDGHDHYPYAPFDTIPGQPPLPGIMSAGPVTDVELAGYQTDNVMGAGSAGSVQQASFTYDFDQLWANISGLADHSFTGSQSFGSGDPYLGAPGAPKITAVNGDLNTTGTWRGAGILIVNGSLQMGGGSMFDGIVIVTGDVDLAGGGPADVARILGGIIYQGSLIDDSSLGGSARVYYCSASINEALTLNRYTLAWWRER